MSRRIAIVISSNGPSGNVLGQLHYAVSDGEKLATILAGPGCGFEVELAPTMEPEAVRSLLYSKAEACQPADTFLVYFAGHGGLGQNGLLLLLDETGVAKPLSTGLLGEDLMRAMRASRAGSRILILDCCNARQIVRQEGWRSAEERMSMLDLGFASDSYDIILASDVLEGAREFADIGGGFLTVSLVEALGSGRQVADADNDGAISVNDAVHWLQRRAAEHNARRPDHPVPIPSRAGIGRTVGYLTRPPQVWPLIRVPLPDGSPAIVLPLRPEGDWAFAVSEHPVTNAAYRRSGLPPPKGKRLTAGEWADTPSFEPWTDPAFCGDDLPVVCVGRQQAKNFCDWLLQQARSGPWRYIGLPCPELWDMAAFGELYPARQPEMWVGLQAFVHRGAAPAACVGSSRRVNRFGFEDLIGNVWEWCGDTTVWMRVRKLARDGVDDLHPWAGPNYAWGHPKLMNRFEATALEGIVCMPLGAIRRTKGQLRGGGFLDDMTNPSPRRVVSPFLSVDRLPEGPRTSHFDLGFRVAGMIDVRVLPKVERDELQLCRQFEVHSW